MYNSGSNTTAYQNYVEANYPERLKYMPVYVPKSFGVGYGVLPDFQSDSKSHSITSGVSENYSAPHLAHEIGHNMDLQHLYNSAPLNPNDVDWVDDLFDYNNFWCAGSAVGDEITYHVCYDNFEDCNPYANDAFNHCTNNLMAATTIPYDEDPNTPMQPCCGSYISPSQIAKMHRACHIKSIRKYVWGYSTTPYEVTKNETWDFSIKFYQDLVVKSGVTLTIKCEVQMVPQAKIIVEPGAALVIDGGHIKNAVNSDDFWQGIQVYGHSSQNQSVQYQGTVLMMNGASIEGAQNAIRVWKVDDWTSMGGIVQCFNSSFINNRRDVEFMPYSRFVNGSNYPNQSFFTNCEFYWDDELMSPHPANAHVTLYKVEGVKFIGSNFEDRRTNLAEQNTASGIFSIDAKYKVLSRSTVVLPPNTPQDEYYNETNYDVCTFKGLSSGIHAMGAASQNTITVDRTKFTDCKNGVILAQVDNAMLTRNKFELTASAATWLQNSQIDIVLDRSSAYQVEGNVFDDLTTNPNNPHNTTSVMIENGGSSANEVFKNQTNHMSIGMHSYGQNKMQGSNTTSTGLQFKCNDYLNNHLFDEYVYKDPLQTVNGMRYLQGEVTFFPAFQYTPSGNAFSSSIIDDPNNGFQNDRHIYNLYDVPMRYVYQLGQINSEPTAIEGDVTVAFTTNTPACPSSFSSIGVGVPGPVLPALHTQLVAEFESTNTEAGLKQAGLNTLLALGDNLSLHLMVALLNPFTKYTVKALLELNSPYLSESLLRELADKSPFFYPSEWLKNHIIDNIEVAQNPNFLAYLSEKQVPMSEAQIAEIKAQLGNFTFRGKQELDLLRLKTEKTRIANILIKGLVQDTINASKADFQEWVVKRGDVLSGFQLADDLLERGEKTACSQVLDSIENTAFALSDRQLKTEITNYVAFKRKLIALSDENGVLQWNEAIRQQMIGYTKSNASYTRVQAQNLLCFFTGNCKTYGVVLPEEGKSLQQEKQESENPSNAIARTPEEQFILYPNPASNTVNVHIDGFEKEADMFVFDVSGREVLHQTLTNTNTEIDLSSLGKGMYTVWLQTNQKDLGMQKLVIK